MAQCAAPGNMSQQIGTEDMSSVALSSLLLLRTLLLGNLQLVRRVYFWSTLLCKVLQLQSTIW